MTVLSRCQLATSMSYEKGLEPERFQRAGPIRTLGAQSPLAMLAPLGSTCVVIAGGHRSLLLQAQALHLRHRFRGLGWYS